MSPHPHTNLRKFMIDLAQDPAQVRAFKANPAPMMAEANLSQEEQSIMLAGNPDEISDVFGPNGPKHPVVIILNTPVL